MNRVVVIAGLLSACGFAVLALEAPHGLPEVALAYLVAHAFALSLPLGILGWAMVCDACGAVWFVPLRRCADALYASLPVLALLFIPLLLNLDALYAWARSGYPGTAVHGAARASYLTPHGVALRAGLCFACWLILAETLRAWSQALPRSGGPDWSARRRSLATAGLPPLALTVTVAAVDWYMSRDDGWPSTIYGLLQLSGAATAGVAILVVILALALRLRLIAPVVRPDHLHALGNLLLVSVMLWAYLAFMQLLVIWMADQPDEADWYVRRFADGWGWLALAVLVLHFLVPFPLLLVRAVKRNLRAITTVSVLLLIAHYGDLLWQLVPARASSPPPSPLAACSAMVAILGAGVACAAWRSDVTGLLAVDDPDFTAGLAYRENL